MTDFWSCLDKYRETCKYSKCDPIRLDFPEFSVSTFFANFGGSLGLWLGVGAVQLLENILQFSKWINKRKQKQTNKIMKKSLDAWKT